MFFIVFFVFIRLMYGASLRFAPLRSAPLRFARLVLRLNIMDLIYRSVWNRSKHCRFGGAL